MYGSEGRDLKGRLARGANSTRGFTPLLSRKRLLSESGHGQVGNETTGMQTTKVAEAISLKIVRSKRDFFEW